MAAGNLSRSNANTVSKPQAKHSTNFKIDGRINSTQLEFPKFPIVTPSVSNISGIAIWPKRLIVFVKKSGVSQPENRKIIPRNTEITRGSFNNFTGEPPPDINQTPKVILYTAIIEKIKIAYSKPGVPNANRQIGIPKFALLPKINGAKKVLKLSFKIFTVQNIVKVTIAKTKIVAKNTEVKVAELILVCIKDIKIKQGMAKSITNFVINSTLYACPALAQNNPRRVNRKIGKQISMTANIRSMRNYTLY